jgi:hypothetical protein
MKFTVFTRGSRSMASRKCFRNIDPLAPVVATVRFSGAAGAKWALHKRSSKPRHPSRGLEAEDRDAGKASQGG